MEKGGNREALLVVVVGRENIGAVFSFSHVNNGHRIVSLLHQKKNRIVSHNKMSHPFHLNSFLNKKKMEC